MIVVSYRYRQISDRETTEVTSVECFMREGKGPGYFEML
jgi:hypothetical protein